MQEQGGLARRRRALERRSADADHRPAAGEARQQLGQPLGAGDGVELVARLGEPRRCSEVIVRAERHDEDVGLVPAASVVTRRASGSIAVTVSRRKRTPGLTNIGVRKTTGVERGPPEHDVELRVAEHERVVLVDQRDLHLAGHRLRQHRRQLETAEACSQDHDADGGI